MDWRVCVRDVKVVDGSEKEGNLMVGCREREREREISVRKRWSIGCWMKEEKERGVD